MNFINLLSFSLWAILIEFIGALIIVGSLLASLVTIARTREIGQGRYLATTGVITGLSFKLAGTLLKTLQLQTWQQILMFTAIFVLRTALKRFFEWEQAQLKRAQGGARQRSERHHE